MFTLFGFQPDEISLDTETYGNVHPDDLPIINNALNQIRESGQPVEFEIRRLSKEGQIVYVLSKGRPDALVDGQVTGVKGITMNVTAFKEKENALFQSEKFNKSILDIVPNIIYIYDLEEEDYFFVNRRVDGFPGYNESYNNSLENQPHFKLIHPDDQDKFQKHLSNCRDMNDHQVLEVEYRCQSGERDYKYLLSRDTVYKRNNDGIVIQIMASFVTSRK